MPETTGILKQLSKILFWCGCLGIVPILKWESNTFQTKRVHSILVLVLGLSLQVARWVRNIIVLNQSKGAYLLPFSQQLSMTILLLVVMTAPLRWKSEELDKIFKYFDRIGDILQVKLSGRIAVTYILVNLLLACYWGYQGLHSLDFLGITNMFTLVHQYHYIFNVTVLHYFILDGILKYLRCIVLLTPVSKATKTALKLSATTHFTIYEILAIFNNLFGYHMLLTAIFVNFRSLDTLYSIFMSDEDTLYKILKEGLPMILVLVQYLCVPFKVEQIKKELKMFERKCNMLLLQSLDDPVIIRELDLLCEQSRSPPRISAAGFFAIDHTMIFLNLNLFVSYIVVLIEFMPENCSTL